jgi:hypothetical protein
MTYPTLRAIREVVAQFRLEAKTSERIDAGSRGKNAAILGLTAWVVATFAASAASLPLPNIGFAQDLGLMLDAGWRYYQGLRPHADYHSPFGPVLGMLFGVPMKLFGPSYSSLRFLPAFVSAGTAFWAWAVCGESLRPLQRFSAAVAIGAVAGGIYHQGFSPEVLTFATFYNRVGFGLLAIVVLATLLPFQNGGWQCGLVRDISVVIAVTTMAFFKANFAVASIPFVSWTIWQRKRSRAEWLAVGSAASLLGLFFLAQIGFRPDLMIADLLMAASGRSKGVGYLFFPVRNTLANYDFIGLMILQTVALAAPLSSWAGMWRPQLQLLTTLWLPGLVGLALTVTQSHGDGRGIILVISGMAAALAQRFPGNSKDAGTDSAIRRAIGTLTLVFACLLFAIPHATSYWTLYRVSLNPGPPQFPPGQIRELYVGPYTDLGADYLPAMLEGIGLLSRNCRPGDSLQFLGGCNIFSFSAGMRSPRKSMLFWCGMSTFSEKRHPSLDAFEDTQFILKLKDKYIILNTWLAWKPIYSYYLSSHFETRDEGKYFELLERRAVKSQ